jgi:ornithine carbamoyltransferase
LKDTARVVSRYADAMIVRTYAQDKLVELADFSTVPVVNALSDDYHPCQVMSDVLTMSEALGGVERLQGTKVAWIGDGNNMAHSFMNAAVHFGFDLHLACPPGYDPDRGIMERCVSMGASITLGRDPRQAAQGARFLNTDVWASMGEEAEQAERAAAFKGFSIGRELLALASPDARVMHCLPAHRGEEIAADVLEGPASIVWDQAENRLHMQKSILEWLFLDRESQVVRDG